MRTEQLYGAEVNKLPIALEPELARRIRFAAVAVLRLAP